MECHEQQITQNKARINENINSHEQNKTGKMGWKMYRKQEVFAGQSSLINICCVRAANCIQRGDAAEPTADVDQAFRSADVAAFVTELLNN